MPPKKNVGRVAKIAKTKPTSAMKSPDTSPPKQSKRVSFSEPVDAELAESLSIMTISPPIDPLLLAEDLDMEVDTITVIDESKIQLSPKSPPVIIGKPMSEVIDDMIMAKDDVSEIALKQAHSVPPPKNAPKDIKVVLTKLGPPADDCTFIVHLMAFRSSAPGFDEAAEIEYFKPLFESDEFFTNCYLDGLRYAIPAKASKWISYLNDILAWVLRSVDTDGAIKFLDMCAPYKEVLPYIDVALQRRVRTPELGILAERLGRLYYQHNIQTVCHLANAAFPHYLRTAKIEDLLPYKDLLDSLWYRPISLTWRMVKARNLLT